MAPTQSAARNTFRKATPWRLRYLQRISSTRTIWPPRAISLCSTLDCIVTIASC